MNKLKLAYPNPHAQSTPLTALRISEYRCRDPRLDLRHCLTTADISRVAQIDRRRLGLGLGLELGDGHG